MFLTIKRLFEIFTYLICEFISAILEHFPVTNKPNYNLVQRGKNEAWRKAKQIIGEVGGHDQ